MPRANGARVARNLGRLVGGISQSSTKVDFGSSATYRVGASNQSGGSILFWFRWDGVFRTSGTVPRLVNLVEGANNVSIYYYGSTTTLMVSTAGGAVAIDVGTGYQMPPRRAVCYVLTWTSTGLKLYANGVLIYSNANDVRPAFGATPQFTLGNWIVSTLSVGGEVGGETYLFDRALSKGEVEAHYFDGEVPSAPVSAWGPSGWPATGTTVTLTGGSGNNGTIVGSVVLMNEPAEQKPALATRQRVGTRFQQITTGTSVGGWVIADHATLKPASFTIEARVRSDAWAAGTLGVNGTGASNYRGIVVKTSVVNWNDGWGLVELANAPAGQKHLRLWVGAYGNGTTFLVSPHTKEMHIVGTYDGATARFYVDGELVHYFAAGAVAQVAQPIRIGHGYAAGASGGYALEGSVRDVRYYSRVLSDVEVRARFQDDLDIESGLIAAWSLGESRRQSAYNVFVGVVAKDRVGGFDAVWTNGTYGADADDIGTRRAPRRKNIERVNIPWLSGSAMSALDASMVIGTGSFSVVGTFRIHSWNANVNNLLVATDNATYANGWFLSYTAVSEATLALTGYLGSGGPNVNGTTSGRVTVQRGKTFRLAFVADATTQKCSWYLDGVRLSEVTIAAWNLPNTPSFAVGRHTGIAAATGCQAADVRYAVGRAWTKEEIEADANGVDDALSGVTHAWPMDDAPGAATLRATKGSSPLLLTNGAAVGQLAIANDYTETPKVQALGAASAFSNAQWTKSNLSFSGAVAGPDGVTLDAENLVEDSANTFKQAALSLSSEKALYLRYVFSVDIAASGRTWVALSTGAGVAFQWFNLSTGVLGSRSGTAIVDAWIVSRGNGFYRCTVVTNQAYFQLFPAPSDALIQYTGDGRVALKTANVQVTRLSAVSRGQGIALAPAANVAYDVGSPDIQPSAAQQAFGWSVLSTGTVARVYLTPNVTIASDFSVRFKFRPRAGSYSSVDRLFVVGEYPTGILVTYETGNRINVYWKLATFGFTKATLSVGRDADIVVAFNRTTRLCSIYIDGVLVEAITGSTALDDVTSPLAVGSGGSAVAVGTYRQFRAYRRCLTQGDAQMLYRGEEPGGEFVHWKLDEGVNVSGWAPSTAGSVRGYVGGDDGACSASNSVWTRD